MSQQQDILFMKKALRLARRGGPRVCPNPMVGCVIVKDGKIVGNGYHEYFGGPHAEINALKQAGDKANGSTLYVTLEPCAHQGKTPPCADAIIRSGVRKVVIAMKDPNKNVAGSGIRKLTANNISVKCGVLRSSAEKMNADYCAYIRKVRPYVILKMAMSLDGKIATRSGDSKWISSEASRKCVHRLRSKVDGVMVGVNTVLKDNPELTSHGQGKNPVRIIIDPILKTPVGHSVISNKSLSIFIYNSILVNVIPKHFSGKNNIIVAPLRPGPKKRIDFREVIALLGKMNINKILIEGGGGTAANAIEDGIVDELNFFIAPIIVGGREAITPVEGTGVANIKDAYKVKRLHLSKIGGDILIKGYL
jgi:diaminohydroxyphosphoribosylaminopyrimidine deaminase/5-amino-6-(5-phosphoribosylamino)uracil reductase